MLGNPGLITVDLVCNKDMHISVLVSQQFCMVFFTNLCMLLLVYYVDSCTVVQSEYYMTYAELSKKFLNCLEIKVVAISGQPIF